MNKHIIFTNGRSGSNYLVNLLNAHPQVVNYGEVLGSWTLTHQIYKKMSMGREPDVSYLKYIYDSKIFFFTGQCYSVLVHLKEGKEPRFKNLRNVKNIGIKDFSLNFMRNKIEDFIWETEDLQVINLYRENSLQRFVSFLMLKTTNVVKLDSKDKATAQMNKLHVDVAEFMQGLDAVDLETKQQLETASKVPSHRLFNVSYEDLFSPHLNKQLQEEILQFLGVEPLAITSTHKKILPVDLSKVIENYDEILPKLRSSKYEKFI